MSDTIIKPLPITRANVEDLLDRHRLQLRMNSGNWWDMRRNGKTKTWKRDPHRLELPVKVGLRCCTRITDTDFVRVDGVPVEVLNPELYRLKP